MVSTEDPEIPSLGPGYYENSVSVPQFKLKKSAAFELSS